MMKLKTLILAAFVAAAMMALAANSASATTLEVGGVAKNEQVTYTETLKSGTSAVLRDTFGFSANTCTGADVHWDSINPYVDAKVGMIKTTMEFTNCSDPVTVHKLGTGSVQHTSGTNGTVTSAGAEFTSDGPFGYLNCKTGTGTHLGTLTGVKEGNATMDINATLDCGISAKLVATYTVTSPSGLGVTS